MAVLDVGIALLTLISVAITDISIASAALGFLLFGANGILLVVVGAPILRDGLRERGIGVHGEEDEEDEGSDEEDEDEEGN